MKELKERVSANETRLDIHARKIEDLFDSVNKLQENIGMIDVYKEIIKNSEETHHISKETYKFITIIITILSILIIVLGTTIFFNQKEFTRYREESITKAEIIDILKNLE